MSINTDYSNPPGPCPNCGALPKWMKGEEHWYWGYEHTLECAKDSIREVIKAAKQSLEDMDA